MVFAYSLIYTFAIIGRIMSHNWENDTRNGMYETSWKDILYIISWHIGQKGYIS